MQVTYDPTAPYNAIPALADVPMAMIGKPSKGQDSGRWDEIILSPDAVVNGAFRSARAIIVTSQGFATPCDITGFVRQTTNGNYVCKVKRDAVPDDVKALRQAMSSAQKADYKANGPKARTAREQAPAPVLPGQTATPATAPAPEQAPAPDQTALLAELARLQALVAAQNATATPATAPAPTLAPRKPRGK
jgi:hypothetical protein